MKHFSTVLMLAASAALAGCAQTETVSEQTAMASSANKPLRPMSKCIDVDKVGEWYVVEPKTVIVRTGPTYFRIDMSTTCTGLGYGGGLSFRINPANANLGRLCGDMLDAIYANGIPCPIDKVTPISKKRFRELEDMPRS